MSSPNAYYSPVLAKLSEKERPNDGSVCPTCPASVWLVSPKNVRCSCQVLRGFSWGPGVGTIIDCDAREAALSKLASGPKTE